MKSIYTAICINLNTSRAAGSVVTVDARSPPVHTFAKLRLNIRDTLEGQMGVSSSFANIRTAAATHDEPRLTYTTHSRLGTLVRSRPWMR